MKTIKIIAIILGVIVFSLFLFIKISGYGLIDVRGKKFFSKVVSSPSMMQKGLGGKEIICRSCAMFFDFGKKDKRSFWMKEMKFDLDIIWVADYKIIHIEKNVSYNFKGLMAPEEDADGVLEIRAGLSDEYGFRTGDRIKIW